MRFKSTKKKKKKRRSEIGIICMKKKTHKYAQKRPKMSLKNQDC
jgi:hypothetical protein